MQLLAPRRIVALLSDRVRQFTEGLKAHLKLLTLTKV